MSFQPSADSFDIRLLGFKCSWWHPRQANDAVASELSIFSKNHDYKKFFFCVLRCGEPVGTYILGSTCVWWQKTTNRQTDRQTDTQTHTHETTTVTLAAHACQGLIIVET